MEKGTPIAPETRQKIIEMRQNLASWDEIVTTLNVSKTTVSRVLREANEKEPVVIKSKPAPAFPTLEQVSRRASDLGMTYGRYTDSEQYEIDCANGIFKAGGEYSNEAKRKEPASAATDTSSEQNIIDTDNSASIITEKSEDVKPAEIEINDTYEGDDVYRDEPVPPRKFAQITIDAIRVRIGCQQEHIKHLSDDMDENYREIERLNKKTEDLDEQMKIAEDELEQLKADYKFMGGEDYERVKQNISSSFPSITTLIIALSYPQTRRTTVKRRSLS